MSVIDKINAFFKSENLDLKVEEKQTEERGEFVSAVLQGGQAVEIEPALEVGAAVLLVTEDELLPAPDGEHILEDNTAIVTEGGLIVSIQTPEEAEDEAVEEMDKEPTTTEAEREAKKVIESVITEKQFNELQKTVEDQKEVIDYLTKNQEELVALFNDKFNGLHGLFNELFAEPKEEPIKKDKNPLKKNKKNIFLMMGEKTK